jgi:hypothetical protein
VTTRVLEVHWAVRGVLVAYWSGEGEQAWLEGWSRARWSADGSGSYFG